MKAADKSSARIKAAAAKRAVIPTVEETVKLGHRAGETGRHLTERVPIDQFINGSTPSEE